MAGFVVATALGLSLAAATPWGSVESREYAVKATDLRLRGDYAAASAVFQEGHRQAVRTGNFRGEMRFLNSLGGCQFIQFQFQKALQYWLEARQLAERNPGEGEEHGAILFNLASLYLASHNLSAAAEAAGQGVRILKDRKRPYYLPRLNLILAVIATRSRDVPGSLRYFADAIQTADEAGDEAALSLSFHHSGIANLEAGDLERAESHLHQAFRLRKLQNDPELLYTLVGIGELQYTQGQLGSAMRMAEGAEALAHAVRRPYPRHIIHHLKAKIYARQGNWGAANEEFRRAFDSIRDSRADLLPADFFRVQAEATLENLYDSALRNAMNWQNSGTAPSTLAAETWLSAEDWKSSAAASPERNLAYERLDEKYWQTLAEFRDVSRKSFFEASARNGATKTPANAGTERLNWLRVRLAEMESYAGVRPFSSVFPENSSTSKALTLFRSSLGPDTVLIRFHLGPRISLRWTLSKDGIEWKELPDQTRLNTLVKRYSEALRNGKSDGEVAAMGQELYDNLFGKLPQAARHARHWLLALDGALHELPVAALAVPGSGTASGTARYLIEERSLAIVPGAYVLIADSPEGGWQDGFLGVGDAVYNTADPRWARPTNGEGGAISGWLRRAAAAMDPAGKTASAAGMELPRLASSRTELERSARAWGGHPRLLTGGEANRAAAVQSIERGAAILHFSTHFVQKEGAPGEAVLVLSLDSQGKPELFTTSDAVHVRVRNSLVVMSGCHSAAGAVFPGAGVVGMTRAWLMAGARGVIASLWPTPDDSGAIFQIFYRELQNEALAPAADTPARGFTKESAGHRGQFLRKAAEALRKSQLEMLRTRTWRALPKYWGTYQLTARMT